MGQTKPVTVYRLVCRGTVDEVLLNMQQKKSRLHDVMLQDSVDAKDKKASAKVMAQMLAQALTMADSL